VAGSGPLEGVACVMTTTVRPNLQGPTACLGRLSHLRGSTPWRTRVVLTLEFECDLMVNVPHSGACSTTNECRGTEHMDETSRPRQMAP